MYGPTAEPRNRTAVPTVMSNQLIGTFERVQDTRKGLDPDEGLRIFVERL